MYSINCYVYIADVQMGIEVPCVIVADFCELELHYISHPFDYFSKT